MSESHQDIVHEFPEYQDKFRYLKMSDRHFVTLIERFADVVKRIHRSEQRIDLLSALDEEQLKKERLVLKEEIYEMLKRPHS